MSDSVLLPLRVTPQPVPFLNPGGDCGACVLSGLAGMTVQGVYKALFEDEATSISLFDMQRALRCDHLFGWAGYQDNFPMLWSGVHTPWQAWGLQARHQQISWFRYVRIALEAGYYGICNVRHDKSGPHSDGPDHWVLICGARTTRVALSETAARYDNEILVSCSAISTPAEEWVGVDTFLMDRGGFNIMLVRPRPAQPAE